jgi:hypothetical protein
VALVTDGRMSGASGKVPAAIHVTPEAKDGGPIAKIRDGDMIRLDAVNGTLEVLVPAEEFTGRRNPDQLAAARGHVHDALLGVLDTGFIHCFLHLVPDLAVVHEGFLSLQIICPRSHVLFPWFAATPRAAFGC